MPHILNYKVRKFDFPIIGKRIIRSTRLLIVFYKLIEAEWRIYASLIWPSLVQIMACRRRRQAIIWTNAGILLIGPLGTNFSEIWIRIQTFSLKKIHLKMSSAKWRLFCLGLNVLNFRWYGSIILLFLFVILCLLIDLKVLAGVGESCC